MPTTAKNITPPNKNGKDFSAVWIILALLLFIAVISFFFLSRQSLRLDEAQTLWQSSRSPSGILWIVAQDVHVPLYHILLHFWQMPLGNSVPTVRLFSLAFFLASIPLTYLVGKKAFSKNIAIFATALMAISPFLNWYGNEVRMYSLLLFVTLLNQYFFLGLFVGGETEKSSRPHWTGFVLSAFFGIFTHYFFWFILLIEGVFFLFYRKIFPPKTFRNLALLALLLLLSVLPWFWYVRSIGIINNSDPLLGKPSSVNFFNTFSQFLFGFQNDHLNTIIVSLWPLSVALAFLSLRKNLRTPPQVVFFFLSALLPIVLAFFISVFVRPLFLTRYLILTVPSLFLFFSWFLSAYSKRLSLVLKTGLVLIMLITLITQIRDSNLPVKENYRDAAAFLSARAKAEDVIIVSAPFTIYPLEYYYNGPSKMTTLPLWDRFKTGAIPAFSEQDLPTEVAEINGSHRLAYLVLSYDQGYENNIRYYFDTHFQRLEEKIFSNGLRVYVYKLRYDDGNFGGGA